MTIRILQHGFIALIPSLTVIMILSLMGIILFMSGRSIALNHLQKYHIPEILTDEIKEILAKNKELMEENKKLKEQNTLLKNIVSGIRHLTRRLN